jgi:hypothetical protein
MSLSSMEQKMQTVIVKQKMSNLDEEGRLRKVLLTNNSAILLKKRITFPSCA